MCLQPHFPLLCRNHLHLFHLYVRRSGFDVHEHTEEVSKLLASDEVLRGLHAQLVSDAEGGPNQPGKRQGLIGKYNTSHILPPVPCTDSDQGVV